MRTALLCSLTIALTAAAAFAAQPDAAAAAQLHATPVLAAGAMPISQAHIAGPAVLALLGFALMNPRKTLSPAKVS